jgi:catechol 2,3-dioxygenase-like lactoylglutathione lyase family enzyme
MRIRLASVSISNYDRALKFYTGILGFVKKRDIALGHGMRWLTVVSPEDPEGAELLLEPNARYPAMKALRESLRKDGIPIIAFEVDDVEAECTRLKKLGVRFVRKPRKAGVATEAVFDDTCGNLVQIYRITAR